MVASLLKGTAYTGMDVHNLQRNKNMYFEHQIIKFSVKLMEREKTPLGNKPTYDGWIIIHQGGVVLSAHCPCVGG